ncbi:alpha-hydroxy acid oxidase [Streptomyces sp. cg40]|uniref:alpha-hydroxy acid oxidase n=1 Tax=Streptomyces sp. cg40 TaxID=3419764 RepID=UPI003D093D14
MILNIDDYRAAAKRRLPKPVFDIIDGGAADERTLRRNREAFDQIALRPRSLGDAGERDLSTTVLGEHVSLPVLLDPAGFARMAHRSAELAVARAAAAAGVVYGVSTVTSFPLEEVAQASNGPKWFQLYPPADRQACAELIDRAKAAGYSALCVTIDGTVGGNRERDRRNRISVPLRVTPAMLAHGALRPRWALDFLLGGAGRGFQGMKGVDNDFARRGRSVSEAGQAIAATARSVSAPEIAFIRDRWSGPMVIKGVHRGDECDLMIGLGADAFVVSNHGGRQLDGVLSSIEILPEVVAAVAGRAEVYVDSGFRRGTDVVKALALGARGVLVGRPYLFGLAVGGEAGVTGVLGVYRREIDNAMALLGCSSLRELQGSTVQLLPGFAGHRP